MRILFSFIKRTAVGGVLFLLPVALVVFLAGQLIAAVRPVAREVAALFGQSDISPFWLTIGIFAAFLVIAFLAGLVAATAVGDALTNRLETLVLDRVPGYRLIKSTAADVANSISEIDATKQDKAVLVRSGRAWQIGFVMGQLSEQSHVVFVPDAPSPDRGSVLVVGAEDMVESSLNATEALACLRRLGAGTPDLRVPVPARTP